MTTYPVYDVSRSDFTRDCLPIGHASSSDEAMALLRRFFDGATPPYDNAPTSVELNDRDVGATQIWGYWPIWG